MGAPGAGLPRQSGFVQALEAGQVLAAGTPAEVEWRKGRISYEGGGGGAVEIGGFGLSRNSVTEAPCRQRD